MFPSEAAIVNVFASQHPRTHSPVAMTGEVPAKRTPFPAWNVIDETKKEASRELDAASQKAQATTGKIEPWTAKYYAACTFGGLLACVSSISPSSCTPEYITVVTSLTDICRA